MIQVTQPLYRILSAYTPNVLKFTGPEDTYDLRVTAYKKDDDGAEVIMQEATLSVGNANGLFSVDLYPLISRMASDYYGLEDDFAYTDNEVTNMFFVTVEIASENYIDRVAVGAQSGQSYDNNNLVNYGLQTEAPVTLIKNTTQKFYPYDYPYDYTDKDEYRFGIYGFGGYPFSVTSYHSDKYYLRRMLLDNGNSGLMKDNKFASFEFIELPFAPRCEGVYLKWLNRYGAWSYWLFEDAYTDSVEVAETLIKEGLQGELYSDKTGTLKRAIYSVISNDYVLHLRGLVMSPCVYLYKKARYYGLYFEGGHPDAWIKVNIPKGSFTIRNNKNQSQTVRLTIEYPQIKTAVI